MEQPQAFERQPIQMSVVNLVVMSVVKLVVIAASVWKTANLNLFCPESPRFVCPCDTLQERILTSSFHAWLRYVMILRTSLALRFRDIKVCVDSSERLRILPVCVKIDVPTRVEFFF